MIKKAVSLFVSAYLLLIFCVYPFYMPQGYVDIGEHKHKFLIYSSIGGLGILFTLGMIQAIVGLWHRYREKEAYLVKWDQIRISVTDLLVALYGIEITISYILSDYKQEALWGTEGWHIGLILQLTLCGLYFAISRNWKENSWIWYETMAASGIVFALGIMDRFSVYLIPLDIRNPGFISTLGNINWFCGYLSVLAPIGACLLLFGEKPTERWLAGIYLVIAFMAGFTQGSSSIFLFFGALFFIGLWIAVPRREWVGRWFFMVALWGISACFVRVLRSLQSLNYNYEKENFCGYVTDSWLPVGLALLCMAVSLYIKRKKRVCPRREKNCRMIRLMLTAIPAAAVLVWAVITWINTKWGISGLVNVSDVFLFNGGWGNGRGETWKAGTAIFRQMNFREKLFGAGTDCFSAYAYSQPRIAGALRDYFGENRLTNAHNELLTELVNVGIIGAILFVGIFVSGIGRCFKRAGENSYLLIPVVCIFCYLIHNTVSFAQVLNFPYIFLIAGMGERMIRFTESH